MYAESARYVFIVILDPEYIFFPSETPTNCAQQQGDPALSKFVQLTQLDCKKKEKRKNGLA
jgi:hypothetical protein